MCQICGAVVKRIVAHYRKSHRKNEVYVSRLSLRMAERAKKRHYSAFKCGESTNPQLSAFCYFCETQNTFSPTTWFDHIRSHTGEYAYGCGKCKRWFSSNHKECCSQMLIRKIQPDSRTKEFIAYICSKCNYVQIDEGNILKHLHKEHEEEDINEQYQRIALLPPFNSL